MKGDTYYARNKEARIAYQRDYDNKHPKGYDKKYYDTHKKERAQSLKRWRVNHPEKARASRNQYKNDVWKYMQQQKWAEINIPKEDQDAE